MKFLFDEKDPICLPMAFNLISEIKPFIEKIKTVDFDEETAKQDKKNLFMTIAKRIMVEYPEETANLLSKFWILEEKELPVTNDDGEPVMDEQGKPLTERRMEDPPNVFKTLAAFCSSQAAIDFFACALPALAQLSGGFFRRSK